MIGASFAVQVDGNLGVIMFLLGYFQTGLLVV